MADEWEDVDDGITFGRGNYTEQVDRTKSETTEDSGWQESGSGCGSGWPDTANNYQDYNGTDSDKSYYNRGDRGRGRGGIGGRGRGGYNRGGGDDNNRDNRYNKYGDNQNENGFRGERGQGRGRGSGRGGNRGGRADNENCFRNNDQNGENDDKFTNTKPKEFYIPPEIDDENELFGSNISSGINFDKFSKIPIKVSGENIPPAMESFGTSNIKPFLLENIARSGYTIPTPIQKNAIPIILQKRDLMACAQTGSGKTAAFLLPIIQTLLESQSELSIGKPHVLIVSPTRELSIQIYNEAKKFASRSFLKISLIYGGTATRHQGDNLQKGCHILVATPGRLLDFVEKGFVAFDHIKFIVLDEADRMLDMGFMPNVEIIMNHPTMVSEDERQTLMFSATFPEDIQRLAGKFLRNYIFLAIGIVGGACTDVEQNFFCVGKFEKRKKLSEILEQDNPNGTMVFVETKRNADFLASLLSESKIPTTSIHGDRLQREREEALRDFKSGHMRILIATSVAARGLDIKNVSHVINYDLPSSIDEYVHRIGRTGRVGNRGKATSFYDPEKDAAIAGDLIKILQQADQPVPDFLSSFSYGNGSGDAGKRDFGGRDVRKNFENAAPLEEETDW